MKIFLLDIYILVAYVFSRITIVSSSGEPEIILNSTLVDKSQPSSNLSQRNQYEVSTIDAVINKEKFHSKTIDLQACPDSSEDFPDLFSKEDLKTWWALTLVILVGIYCFTILAIICDKYFLPCVEVLCEVFNLTQDVAAATFMSVATSTPELFVNIIGTFITKSDIGIGTIVGSSLFNALGVAAIGGLAAAQPIQLDWWPLTRDVIIYICAVFLLVAITWDGYIYWYEGLILFIVYFIYFTVMFNNTRISNFISKLLPKRKNKVTENDDGQIKQDQLSVYTRRLSARKLSTISPYGSYIEEPHHPQPVKPYLTADSSNMQVKDSERGVNGTEQKEEKSQDEDNSLLFNFPKDAGIGTKLLWLYIFPIKTFLYLFIPDPKRHPNLYPITFLMCILFIGVNSYVVSWMITLIGSIFKIPVAVLGFTFLAAGGCLPESISITIMSRRGEGSMGVSNSLGANTMNILMSLGLPWFLKTIFMGTNRESFIKIQSGSLEYTILGLIGVAIVLYITLYLNKFKLRRRVGVILCVVYFICISLAIVAELTTREQC